MQGAGHSSSRPDPAKKQAWLDEIESRQEIAIEELTNVFSQDLINRIDHEQSERFKKDPKEFVGFIALDGASKDETRLFNMARRNTAEYDEEGEVMLFDDPIVAAMTDPKIRNHFKSSEEFSEAIRLRRTVVAYYLASMKLAKERPIIEPVNIDRIA